jgi:hypothetical protein
MGNNIHSFSTVVEISLTLLPSGGGCDMHNPAWKQKQLIYPTKQKFALHLTGDKFESASLLRFYQNRTQEGNSRNDNAPFRVKLLIDLPE